VVETIQRFMKKGVIIRTVSTGLPSMAARKTPMQKAVRDALNGFMAAMAQAQAEGTKDAQRAGIAHAKASGTTAYRGRKPSFTREQFKTVLTRQGCDEYQPDCQECRAGEDGSGPYQAEPG
jgi:putative DNA-invertase from lambdoid prophage Rac